MALRQSFCYPCFASDTLDFEALCEAAADIGYPAVEWHFRDDRFAERVAVAQRHGLVIACMCGHRSLTSGLNSRTEHERIEAELRESLALAAAHEIPNLICFSGNRLADQPESDALAACADCLRRVARLAEAAGVTLNVELLNSKVDHPGYQCDHTAWGVALCERVGSPNVKLLYDIYHMQVMEGDIIRTIRDNIRWIGHFHTAGNPGRHDLDDTQELNYRAICDAIRGTDFDGYLAHEFVPRGDRVRALEQAFRICAGSRPLLASPVLTEGGFDAEAKTSGLPGSEFVSPLGTHIYSAAHNTAWTASGNNMWAAGVGAPNTDPPYPSGNGPAAATTPPYVAWQNSNGRGTQTQTLSGTMWAGRRETNGMGDWRRSEE